MSNAPTHGRKHIRSHQALLRRLQVIAEGKGGPYPAALSLAWGCFHVGLQSHLVVITLAVSVRRVALHVCL